MKPRSVRDFAALLAPAILLGSMIWATSTRFGAVPPLNLFFDVWHGAYSTARLANEPQRSNISIQALSKPVSVMRDERGVPHIFAQNDLDAVATLGFLTARDRLFQMDIQMRLASGRLAEVVGASMVERDKYLRRTGMLWGAERSWEQVSKTNPMMKQLLEAYTNGVNAYIATLTEGVYPFEFRLLGYAPEPWTPVKTILINQLMAFDLCFTIQTTDVKFAELRSILGAEAFAQLYPDHSPMPEPYSPDPKGVLRNESTVLSAAKAAIVPTPKSNQHDLPHEAITALQQGLADVAELYGEAAEGKGSNNWVVSGKKTKSGKPLLAGDPHLGLSLPSIWYEAHLSTPTMNVYGVTIPGAPLIIVGFNDYVAWSPTNTGADVLDFYTVNFDGEKQQRYKYQGEWLPVHEEIRPIRVKASNGAVKEILDTVRYTRWGPVITQHQRTLAIRWTAHEPSTILEALWGFNHAHGWREFSDAQRKWDVPAQNIVFADRDGNVAIRSCGHYPIRKGGDGKFIVNGETDQGEWTGRIPFDSIPASLNPDRNWLSSANQEPTPPDYPYYLGYNWTNPFRGKRIGETLNAASGIGWEDFQTLQTDVLSMQFRFVSSTLAASGATQGLKGSPQKQAIEQLLAWNGVTDKTSTETLLFKLFWDTYTKKVWDELPDSLAGEATPTPPQDVLCSLTQNEPQSAWFDRKDTPEREDARGLCKQALLEAADSLVAKYGAEPTGWVWGKHHTLVVRHLLRESVKPLWRGPFAFPGFSSTVLPAGGMQTTHSASWRLVADFANGKPEGHGVFPGGPSGNPFSTLYDSQMQQWLEGKLYALYKPASQQEFDHSRLRQEISLTPR